MHREHHSLFSAKQSRMTTKPSRLQARPGMVRLFLVPSPEEAVDAYKHELAAAS
jgi:hypothetical protein